jgi:hypothetical protein
VAQWEIPQVFKRVEVRVELLAFALMLLEHGDATTLMPSKRAEVSVYHCSDVSLF